MRRGTTPDFILQIDGYDLTDYTLEVVIRQGSNKIILTGDRLDVEYADDATSILVRLTQEETLGFKPGNISMQVRYIDEDGYVDATEIQLINVREILNEDVIKYVGNRNASGYR